MANLAAHLIHEPYHHLTCFIRNAYRLILMSLKSNKKNCHDPFSRHTKDDQRKLSFTDEDTAESLNAVHSCQILPGWKLCSYCLSLDNVRCDYHLKVALGTRVAELPWIL